MLVTGEADFAAFADWLENCMDPSVAVVRGRSAIVAAEDEGLVLSLVQTDSTG